MTDSPGEKNGTTDDPVPRPDWRESLALAADLALLGIVATLASVAVVTAGGALATASVAADHACRYRSLPPVADLLRTFVRALLPGLGALVAAATATALVMLNLRALSSGQVPGGKPVVVATVVIALGALAVAALTLVRVGTTGGRGWLAAVAWSGRLLAARPWIGVLVPLVLVVPALLAAAIPVTTPLVLGFAIFALHVLVRRTAP